nr:MAG TPA: hypothetical protein [Caudoviricetes sp.]
MATYLDNAGVTQILTKIKSLLAKKAEITAIPTKVSQLTNDSQYQTPDDVTASITTRLGTLNCRYDDWDKETSGTPTYFISGVEQINGKISVAAEDYLSAFNSALKGAAGRNEVVSKDTVNGLINSAVGKITSFEYKIVESLPVVANGKKGVIYLIAHSGSTNQNSYDEYIFLPADGSTAARYEKIGTTDIDLTPYAKKTEIPTAVSDLANDLGFETSENVGSRITSAISVLDYSDTAEEGKYVSSVSETDGVIKVTRASLPAVGTADSPISNTTIESIFAQVFG